MTAGPGRAAIEAVVDAADGGPSVREHHPRAPGRFGRGGPLEAITVHRVAGRDGSVDHWHLVTLGLSEMDAKESEDRQVSGWGFELTIRVPTGPDTDPHDVGREGPDWALDLLANLAVYVWTGRHPFAAGHHLDLRGPIRMDDPTILTAAAVVDDPGLAPLDGPFGRVEFLQVVGLTQAELEACRAWSTEGITGLLGATDPLLVTRLDRDDVLDDPEVASLVAEARQVDGGELTELRVATLDWRQQRWRHRAVVTLGSGASAALGPALRRELVGEGAGFSVVGDRGEVRFLLGPATGWETDDERLVVTVPVDGVDDLARLFDGRAGWGRDPGLPGLRFHVVP